MIGKSLAHYKIEAELGAGGMGVVYRARDTKLDRDVAIKVLPAEFSRDDERRKRFQREARAIAALKHPNIVTIYSVEESDGVDFITMEYVEGATLSALIPLDGVPLDNFFEYAIALADAISAAHDQNVTHRDLKPTNVLQDRDGRLKVLDFGLAKLIGESVDPTQAKTMVRDSDTAVGQILGTAAYMSPEQAQGNPVDHRSDIFSLGIILYEMATGERPFKGENTISTLSAILKDNPRHVSEIKQAMPRHVGRIINQCLQKQPDKRFQTAKDVRNSLVELKREIDSGELPESSTITSAPSMSASTVSEARGSRRWMVWAAAGVVAVAVAAAFWPFGGGDGRDGGLSRVVSTAEAGRQMAVVLPFENLGPTDQAYFAAGMTEEITSRLAAVSGLGVISRTSATQYDRTGKTVKEIGEDLGVDYVLEGTVRWAKDDTGAGRVRITPQLIRVSDDTNVWTATYDRDIDDIFEVQTDIATKVIEELGVTLAGGESERIASAPTKNMQAYALYMQAKDLVLMDPAKYDLKMVELLEEATRLDPGFVGAWSQLSRHHSSWYHSQLDRTEERLGWARATLQEAEAISPDDYHTRLARGYYHYYGFRDYDRALVEFEAALAVVPNDAEVQSAIGYIHRRQGKLEECISDLEAAQKLDPRDFNIPNNIGGTLRALRRFEEAMRAYDAALAIRPDDQVVFFKFAATVAWRGDLQAAREILEDELIENDLFYRFAWSRYHGLNRDYESAIAELEQISETGPFVTLIKRHIIAIVRADVAGREAARAELESVNEMLNKVLETSPGNANFRQWLAVNLAYLGREADAIREARLAGDLTAKDAFEGPESQQALAVVYTIIDRPDEAIDILERLLKLNYSEAITANDLKLTPIWDPLRDHPRFQKLIKENS